MHLFRTLLLVAPIAALALSQAHDAAACGGCLHETTIQQSESTQVTGHQMVLSISKKQTTLWDQITYSGNPSSFAWVLPIKGTVDFGLSSDALLGTLDTATKVTVASPQITCPPPPSCGTSAAFGSSGIGTTGTGGDGAPSVEVLVHDVVGPYEMVQLKSSDPTALQTWLASHNYAVPADVQSIISAYVAEGFNFLALKLVPGQGVSAMRPVRVTTQGASPVLPLRMVAAGTGAITPITLWVLGEGRYETASLPTFTIEPDQLVWDWDTQSSNYAAVKKAAFDKSKGTAWLVEDAEPINQYTIKNPISYLVMYGSGSASTGPANSSNGGYGEPMGPTAQEEFEQDMDALFGGISETSLWVTRLHGELSRTALAADLQVGASADQSQVDHYIQVTKTSGTTPTCPTYQPCDLGGNASDGGWDQWGNEKSTTSCAMTESGSSPISVFALLGAAGVVVSAARRKRR